MNLAGATSFPNNGHSSLSPVVLNRSARARFGILKVLDELGHSAGAAKIAEMLEGTGIQLQARTVRFHLQRMDREGLTQSVTKHDGRVITDTGRKELARINIMRKIGFVTSKMDELSFRMSLDPQSGQGAVIANAAIINKRDLSRALYHLHPVFDAGYSIGDRIAVRMPGMRAGGVEVPREKVLISTICSITLNGLFQKAGIPIVSRFGGLLEVEDHVPRRFTEIIDYQGTSIDPHKVFIMAGMTSSGLCAARGSGIVGASFREFPSAAIEEARKLITTFSRLNLEGVLAVGQPNRPLLDITVAEGRTGMITIAGLNPFAALHEVGIPVEINPLSGLEDLATYVPFREVAPLGRRSTMVD
jgi:repressor of nif and glnA expression